MWLFKEEPTHCCFNGSTNLFSLYFPNSCIILKDILGQLECPNIGSLIHELFGRKVQKEASEMISPLQCSNAKTMVHSFENFKPKCYKKNFDIGTSVQSI